MTTAADIPPMSPAALLYLSDYVDQLLADSLRRERAAFERGRALGREEGRREYEVQETAAWRRLLDRYRDLMRSRSFAELDHKRYGRGGLLVAGHPPDSPGQREQLEAARLPPDAGRWPAEIRRRARLRGEKDPFHLRHGPDMTCTACAYWQLSCPDDEAVQ